MIINIHHRGRKHRKGRRKARKKVIGWNGKWGEGGWEEEDKGERFEIYFS